MKDELIIDVKAKLKPIIKFGFILQGVIILLGVIALGILGITTMHDITWLSVLVIGGALFFFYVAKKYFENVFFTEKLIITPYTITVINKTWARENRQEFELRNIKYLGYAGTINYTEHPMNNKVVDFTGLGTAEKELQFLIDNGTIEIETEETVLRFGKNVSSWDAEEIIEQIERYLKVKFVNKYEVNTDHEGA